MKETIAEIDIDVNGLIKAQAEVRKSINDTKEAMKSLDQTTQEGREEFVKQEATLKNLQTQYNGTKKALSELGESTGEFQDLTKKANTEIGKEVNSINEARESNKRLLAIRNKLNINTDRGAKAAQLINEKIDKNNALIKESVSAYEKQKIGIGDYEGAIKRALPGLSSFFEKTKQTKDGLIAYKIALQSSIAGTTGLTKASKILKIALASTGIGAIVIALGSLVAYLTQTQKGMDLVNRVTAGLQATFQVLIDRLLTFGEGLVTFFSGKFSKGVDKLKESFSGLGDEILKEAGAAATLEGKLQEVEKAEARLEVRRAKSRADIEKLKFAAEDISRSLTERSEAAKEALSIEQELLNDTIKLQKDKLFALKQQNELGTSTEEDLQRVRDAEIELANLQQESVTKQIELNNKLNSFKQQAAKESQDEAKKVAEIQEEENQKIIDKRIADLQYELELQRLTNKSKIKSGEELTDAIKSEEEKRLLDIYDKESEILEAKREAEKITQQEYNLQKLQLDSDYLESRKELQNTFDEVEKEQKLLRKEEEALEYEQRLEQLRLQGESEYQIKVAELDRQQQLELQNAEKVGADLTKIEKKHAAERENIQKELVQTKLSGVADVAGKIAQFAGEETSIGKAAALVQAQINIAQGVTKALASKGLAGVIEGALISAKGIQQTAKIASAKTKFEDGGLAVGRSHAQGGIPFSIAGQGGYELEGGEYIVNKRATAAYFPLLENINKSLTVGYNYGVRSFAKGGLAGSAVIDYDKLANAMASIPPPQVAVTDIANVNAQLIDVVSDSKL